MRVANGKKYEGSDLCLFRSANNYMVGLKKTKVMPLRAAEI
jgi:hypothetical protein